MPKVHSFINHKTEDNGPIWSLKLKYQCSSVDKDNPLKIQDSDNSNSYQIQNFPNLEIKSQVLSGSDKNE